jgi:hypothetical protein
MSLPSFANCSSSLLHMGGGKWLIISKFSSSVSSIRYGNLSFQHFSSTINFRLKIWLIPTVYNLCLFGVAVQILIRIRIEPQYIEKLDQDIKLKGTFN